MWVGGRPPGRPWTAELSPSPQPRFALAGPRSLTFLPCLGEWLLQGWLRAARGRTSLLGSVCLCPFPTLLFSSKLSIFI